MRHLAQWVSTAAVAVAAYLALDWLLEWTAFGPRMSALTERLFGPWALVVVFALLMAMWVYIIRTFGGARSEGEQDPA